jgi:hypothetical protein
MQPICVPNVKTKIHLLMKKLFLLSILCLPLFVNAQKLRYSRAYVGAILHEGKLGGSLILSYGIGKYLGVGAGVDLTSYNIDNKKSKFFAPFYGDLRFKYPAKGIEPFIMAQGGKPSFTQTIISPTSTSPRGLTVTGDYFFGGGIGVASLREKKPNVFVSVTYRDYYFSYSPSGYSRNGYIYEDFNQGVLVITAGLVF